MFAFLSVMAAQSSCHRRYHVAVVLVHHARKGGAKMRGRHALRLERVSCLGRLEPVPPSPRRAAHPLRRAPRRRVERQRARRARYRRSCRRAAYGRLRGHRQRPQSPCARARSEPRTTPRRAPRRRDHADDRHLLRRLCQVRSAELHPALAALVAAGWVHKDRAGYDLARGFSTALPGIPRCVREPERERPQFSCSRQLQVPRSCSRKNARCSARFGRVGLLPTPSP